MEVLQWGCYDLVLFFWLDRLLEVNFQVVCCLLLMLGVLEGEWLSVWGWKMVVIGNDLCLVVMLVNVGEGDSVVIVVMFVVIFEDLLCGGGMDLSVVFLW